MAACLACTSLESASDTFGPGGGSSGAEPNAGASGSEPEAGRGGKAGDAGDSGTGGAGKGGAGKGGEGQAGSKSQAGSGPVAGSGGTDAGRGGSSEAGEAGMGGAAGGGGCPPLEERSLVQIGPPETTLEDDTVWSCDTIHQVNGSLLVAPGASLTIEPGSVVRVGEGGMVLVQRRGRLVAGGSAELPIVFTSAKPEGERGPGDWRGVVLIGDGPSHAVNEPVYNTLGDGRADYGGGPEGEPDGSCGVLRYVRVEFAGGNLNEAANPGAALTLAGCGADTEVEYVQVHRGTDGLGLVGGTVGVRHVLVSANARGDSIEWTAGYRGMMQFVIAQSLGAATALLGSNSENDPLEEPISAPAIYNALLAGSPPLVAGAHFGMALQFGSQVTLKNSVIMGFADAAFDLRLPADVLDADVGPSRPIDISHVLMHGNARNYTADAEVLGTMASMREADAGLSLAAERLAPSFLPSSNEVLIEPAPVPRPFDTLAAFRGAMAPDATDWTLGWTAFPTD